MFLGKTCYQSAALHQACPHQGRMDSDCLAHSRHSVAPALASRVPSCAEVSKSCSLFLSMTLRRDTSKMSMASCISSVRAPTSAPAATNASTTSTSPERAAKCSGRIPSSSRALTWASCFRSTWHVRTCPDWAAYINGVIPTSVSCDITGGLVASGLITKGRRVSTKARRSSKEATSFSFPSLAATSRCWFSIALSTLPMLPW
mmetsp:Transcript_42885/g.100637  ORF Transcript_42885/g.100637 Transcript_42885/m.100637 type:complete len:203 (-) Transcript_42885:284-892(-)